MNELRSEVIEKPSSGWFTLRDMFVGLLMLALALGGLRGIFTSGGELPDRLFWLPVVAVGLGGLYSVLFHRTLSLWQMCLVGFALLVASVGLLFLLIVLL